MSELQISLLILGGLLIAIVYAFNTLKEWYFRKRTRQAFSIRHGDVLLGAGKNSQPVQLDLESSQADAGHSDPKVTAALTLPEVEQLCEGQFDGGGLGRGTSPAAQMDSSDNQALVVAMLDPRLDFISEVVFHAPCELTAIPRFNVCKRTQLIGQTAKGLWKPAEALPGTRYKQLNVSMQLVDRSGAVSEQDLAEFCQQVSNFADENGATVSFPEIQQKLVDALELDRFCVDVDVLIGINIVTQDPIAGTLLRSFFEASGLKLEPDGAFHRLADSGNTLYSIMATGQDAFSPLTLLNQSFSGLTLLFDVPRVADGVEVFDHAVYFARQFADQFNAKLVDDNRRLLLDAGIARIREQLLEIYRSMVDRGIVPGSLAALRLFA